MNSSVHARIRHTGLVLATATALAFVVASSALAGTRPAASFYTPQQLQAMSERWAAEDRYTPQQLQAMRRTWDANASLLARKYASAASFYTPQQLQAMSERWAAEDRYTPQQLQAMRAKWDANARRSEE